MPLARPKAAGFTGLPNGLHRNEMEDIGNLPHFLSEATHFHSYQTFYLTLLYADAIIHAYIGATGEGFTS